MLQSLYCLGIKLSSIATGLLGIAALIGFHELGHFIFAKVFGIRTPTFSIGMGPRIFSFRKLDTDFSLSLIPLGGYVEIAGLQEVGQGEQHEAQVRDEGAFSVKPYWQKFLVLMGGIIFNILLAYIVFTVLFMIGAPKFVEGAGAVKPVVKAVATESPAAQAGLIAHDEIVAVGESPTTNITQLQQALESHAGKAATLTVQRASEAQTLTVNVPANGKIGIAGFALTDELLEPASFFTAIAKGIRASNNFLKQIALGVKAILCNFQTEHLGGPLRIISAMSSDAERGLRDFLILFATLSLNLAVLNLIPVPILDGGQLLFVTIEAIIGRDLPEKVRLAIHYACWILVLGLMLLLTYNDLKAMVFLPLLKKFRGL